MHWTQALFLVGLIGALLIGAPNWRVWAAMAGNLCATMFFASNPMNVMVADLAAAAFLLGAGSRAHIVAFLFACMPIVYITTGFTQWPHATTYAIIDVIAYVQLGVIGYGGGGVSFISRGLRRGFAFGFGAFGRKPVVSVAMVSQEGRA